MNYLKVKPQLPYEIVVFTDFGPFEEFLENNDVGALLANGEEVLRLAQKKNILKILKLSEEPISAPDGESLEYPFIFKYQSAQKILREITAYCVGVCGVGPEQKGNSKGTRILGIYSPVGRCGKTTLALALAQVLGKEGRVLYVNLEEYSGLTEDVLKGNGTNLSEIMYLFRRGVVDLPEKINEAAMQVGNFYYITPMPYPEDVAEVLTEEWRNFIQFLAAQMSWDYIVVDLGNLLLKSYLLLDLFDVTLIPEAEDCMGKNKLRDFIHVMTDMGRGFLLERVVYVKIPRDQEMERCEEMMRMEQLEWSAVGSYARKVVNERGL